jgi:hypothetical protein
MFNLKVLYTDFFYYLPMVNKLNSTGFRVEREVERQETVGVLR